jgi:hypothetical protein
MTIFLVAFQGVYFEMLSISILDNLQANQTQPLTIIHSLWYKLRNLSAHTGIMKILIYQRFREQWKSKLLMYLFSEAPFLRGFYFVKINS